ncbi:hypothetical protein BH23ACT4_BH23ACT4_04950 [soil metagenome]
MTLGTGVVEVLLIDDDEDDYVLTTDLLTESRETDFRVEWVSDPSKGLEVLLEDRHHVSLLDYRLGDVDGIEVLESALAGGCTQPIIVLTGQGDATIDARALRAGAADFVVKQAIDVASLERSIRYALSHAETLNALRGSETRNRALLNAFPDWILRITADGDILDVSQPPGRHDLDRWVGRRLYRQLPQTVAVQLEHQVQTAVTKGRLQVVEFAADLDGSPVDLEARILGIPNSDQLVVIARDISDRKAAERHLQELMAAKDKFIASISHELRTPLTAVVGFAELLHHAGDDLPDTDRRQMIQTIAEQGSDLAALVDDLLVSARLELGQLTVTQVPVTLSAQAAQVLEGTAPNDREVTIEGDPTVARADPARVRQILRNLITNAIRYGGPKLRIHITQAADTAVLQVLDNGPGIPHHAWEDIFRPYHRLNQPTTQTESVGIGLSVSRQLAHLMAGDLTYRHQDGWSTFELTLPA